MKAPLILFMNLHIKKMKRPIRPNYLSILAIHPMITQLDIKFFYL